MKKILSILAVISIIMLTSCGSNVANHPIADHTYATVGKQIHFKADGTAQYAKQDAIGNWEYDSDYNYRIQGKTIIVDHKKLDLEYQYTYNSKDDTLTDQEGTVWKNVK